MNFLTEHASNEAPTHPRERPFKITNLKRHGMIFYRANKHSDNTYIAKMGRFLILKNLWLGRLDSNQGMPVPKTGALPLGYAPTNQIDIIDWAGL